MLSALMPSTNKELVDAILKRAVERAQNESDDPTFARVAAPFRLNPDLAESAFTLAASISYQSVDAVNDESHLEARRLSMLGMAPHFGLEPGHATELLHTVRFYFNGQFAEDWDSGARDWQKERQMQWDYGDPEDVDD